MRNFECQCSDRLDYDTVYCGWMVSTIVPVVHDAASRNVSKVEALTRNLPMCLPNYTASLPRPNYEPSPPWIALVMTGSMIATCQCSKCNV
jgi:hypothetical protein